MRITRIDELMKVRKILLSVLAINVVLSASKLLLGFSSGTLSLVAEGFHSLLDSSANAVAALGLSVSMRPPDEEHPYGHRKFEALSAIAISFFMFLASFEVLQEVIHRLLSKEIHHPNSNALSFAVVIINLGMNIVISTWERKRSEQLKSSLLLADSKHTMSDVWATLALLVTLAALQFNLHFVDIICSILIVGIILHAGFEVIMSHLGPLVDSAMLDPRGVEELVLSVPGVVSCHKVRSRGMSDYVFVDLHVQVNRTMSIEAAHSISFAVEDAIKGFDTRVSEVLVHLEDDSPPGAPISF